MAAGCTRPSSVTIRNRMATRFVPVGLLCWLAAGVSCGLLPDPARAAQTPTHAATVLVFPFENSKSLPKLEWLGEGLAELTIERLAGSGQTVLLREERLAMLEKMGLPASTRFSRATMLRIAEEIDADYVIFGQFASDGKDLSLTARVLRVSPPKLGPALEEKGALEELMNVHARLAWRLLGSIEPTNSLNEGDFQKKLPRPRPDAFEYYVKGLLSADEEQRLRDLREAARRDPSWDAPAFALGQSYFVRRDCASALPWFSRVAPGHERGLEAIFSSGVCHLLRNDLVRAEAAFAGLLARARALPTGSAELPEALNNLGVAWSRMGKPAEAAVEFGRAAQLDPEEADYWFNLGLARLRSGELAAAVAPLREALKHQPEDSEARSVLVAILERSGRSSEAAAAREALARSSAKVAAPVSLELPALVRLDRIRMRMDPASLHPLPETAAQAGAETGASPPHRAQHRYVHLSRGRQFLAAGKLDDAQREFTEAALLAPTNPAAHLGLAEVYRLERRLDDAVRELRAALADRDDPAVRTALARIYLGQDLLSEAREELRLALKLNPGDAEARQMLEQVEKRAAAGEPR